jgi:lipopolysaccharide transport system ATP-binding protein
MPSPAIRVENLSKQYQIGARENGYTTFREAVSGLVKNPLRRFRNLSGQPRADKSFWALKDVLFDVQPGEVVGIIGRNGAGKSTLLKILSQITEPTAGRVEINGRVASLLEVGTGFHPELTGRENIFLNGSILGMSRADVRRNFDEIVEFSGVEHFIDTPVKRYSSGMTVRLAFSVAAHLDPEILIVDEVLAVGDQAFQSRCLGKMGGVARSGRTILFVSHNMAAIEHLCTRGILLERGALIEDGSACGAIRTYCGMAASNEGRQLSQRTDRTGNGTFRLESLQLVNSMARNANVVEMGNDWIIDLNFTGCGRIARPELCLVVMTAAGQRIARIMSTETHGDLPLLEGEFSVRAHIKALNLVPGSYHLLVDLSELSADTIDRVESAAIVEVIAKNVFGSGKISNSRQSASHCYFDCAWTCNTASTIDCAGS